MELRLMAMLHNQYQEVFSSPFVFGVSNMGWWFQSCDLFRLDGCVEMINENFSAKKDWKLRENLKVGRPLGGSSQLVSD